MNIKKRGQLHTVEIAVIIIACLILLLILTIAGDMGWGLKKSTDKQVCKQSVLLHSKIASKTEDFLESALECPAPDIKIEEPTKEAVYIQIVDELSYCWDKMLGRDNRLYNAPFFSSSEDWVVVCSSFTVHKRGNVDEPIKTLDLGKFMDKRDPQTNQPFYESVSTDWFGNGNTHYFLEVEHVEKDDMRFSPLQEIKLSDRRNEERYLIVFTMFSKNGFLRNSIDLESMEFDIQYSDVERNNDRDNTISFHTFVMPESQLDEFYETYVYWDIGE